MATDTSVSTNSLIYREFVTLGRVAWGLGALATASLASGSIATGPLGGWLVVAAIFLGFPTLFLASIYRMNRIALTPDTLSVGNESFHPEDFDFVFGVQPPVVLSPGEQSQVEGDWPLPKGHEIRIAGGSWGRRRGTAMIVLREAERTSLIALFTRRPDVLDPLLTEWVETPRSAFIND